MSSNSLDKGGNLGGSILNSVGQEPQGRMEEAGPVLEVQQELELDEEPQSSIFSSGVGRRIVLFAISIMLAFVSMLFLTWAIKFLHPNSGTSLSPERRGRTDITASLNEFAAANEQIVETPVPSEDPSSTNDPTPTDTPAPSRPHYVIPDGSLPVRPHEACYGTVEIGDAARVLEVIEQARSYGLLDEKEKTAFDPNANFYKYSNIQYYLDETILTICWKEYVESQVCTISEVKVADASQFRRKIAGDTFGSSYQYYATELSASCNAVVAMTADYYAFRDYGIMVYDSTVYRFKTAVLSGRYKRYNVIDNLFIDRQGEFHFMERGTEIEQDELEQFIADNDISFSLAFGPILVRDGVVQEYTWYTLGEINGGYSRAGIGQMGKLHYLYMGVNHEGGPVCTVNTFALHFWEKGVVNAYCLDGGQTSELVFRGRPFNHVDYGEERLVSDIIYFASALPEGVFP